MSKLIAEVQTVLDAQRKKLKAAWEANAIAKREKAQELAALENEAKAIRALMARLDGQTAASQKPQEGTHEPITAPRKSKVTSKATPKASPANAPAPEAVVKAIAAGKTKMGQLAQQFGAASKRPLKRILAGLVKAGKVRIIGKKRAAHYEAK